MVRKVYTVAGVVAMPPSWSIWSMYLRVCVMSSSANFYLLPVLRNRRKAVDVERPHMWCGVDWVSRFGKHLFMLQQDENVTWRIVICTRMSKGAFSDRHQAIPQRRSILCSRELLLRLKSMLSLPCGRKRDITLLRLETKTAEL